jgi:hypothetical protein
VNDFGSVFNIPSPSTGSFADRADDSGSSRLVNVDLRTDHGTFRMTVSDDVVDALGRASVTRRCLDLFKSAGVEQRCIDPWRPDPRRA